MDNIILAENDPIHISSVKTYLCSHFHIKDIGPIEYFVGIKVIRSLDGIVLNQKKYGLDIPSEMGMLGAKSCAFPMEQHHSLCSAIGPKVADPSLCRCLVDRLIYLTIILLDLCYAVHILDQFMHNLLQPHLDAAMWVLCYLKMAPRQGIFLLTSSEIVLSRLL